MARRPNTDEYEALLYGEETESPSELRRKRSVLLGLMSLRVFSCLFWPWPTTVLVSHILKKHAKKASDEIYWRTCLYSKQHDLTFHTHSSMIWLLKTTFLLFFFSDRKKLLCHGTVDNLYFSVFYPLGRTSLRKLIPLISGKLMELATVALTTKVLLNQQYIIDRKMFTGDHVPSTHICFWI